MRFTTNTLPAKRGGKLELLDEDGEKAGFVWLDGAHWEGGWEDQDVAGTVTVEIV